MLPTTLKIAERLQLTDAEKAAVMQLWNCEYPAQLCYSTLQDFERYLNNLANKAHWLLVDDGGEIAGWAIAFDREGERWFAIILSQVVHGLGYGTMMLNALKGRNPKLSGLVSDHDRYIKANGTPYTAPLGFYLKNNFIVRPDSRLELPHLSAVRIEWEGKS